MDNYQIIHFHQPLQLKALSFLEISRKTEYIDEEGSAQTFASSYGSNIKPSLSKLLEMADMKAHPLVFFSISFLEQLENKDPDLLYELQEYVNKEKIILIGSCAYHSFSYLCSEELFRQEAIMHKEFLRKYFKPAPEIFINTACLYDDNIAQIVQKIGYKSIIATANSWHLAGKKPSQLYRANTKNEFNVLLSNGESSEGLQLSLINGYGSAYTEHQMNEDAVNNPDIRLFFKNSQKADRPVYAVSLPLTSPTWEHKIPNYTSNPLQKALLHQIAELINYRGGLKQPEDLQTLMLLCQPDHLMNINPFTKDDGHNQFISSMNILTALSLKYEKES